jgi:hypothetical protein
MAWFHDFVCVVVTWLRQIIQIESRRSLAACVASEDYKDQVVEGQVMQYASEIKIIFTLQCSIPAYILIQTVGMRSISACDLQANTS